MTDELVIESLEAKHPVERVKYILRLDRNSAFNSFSPETITQVTAYVYLLSSGSPTGVSLTAMISATDYSNNSDGNGYWAAGEINSGTSGSDYRLYLKVTCDSGRIYVVAGDFSVLNMGQSSFS